MKEFIVLIIFLIIMGAFVIGSAIPISWVVVICFILFWFGSTA